MAHKAMEIVICVEPTFFDTHHIVPTMKQIMVCKLIKDEKVK